MLRIEEVLWSEPRRNRLSMRILTDEIDLGYVLGDDFDQRDAFGSHCRCLGSSHKGFPGDAQCCNIRWKISLHLPLMGGALMDGTLMGGTLMGGALMGGTLFGHIPLL
jgi:hypothetical protein